MRTREMLEQLAAREMHKYIGTQVFLKYGREVFKPGEELDKVTLFIGETTKKIIQDFDGVMLIAEKCLDCGTGVSFFLQIDHKVADIGRFYMRIKRENIIGQN